MSSTALGLLVFACLCASVMLAMRLRALLPAHHLSNATQDTMKLAMGLVATTAAPLPSWSNGPAKQAILSFVVSPFEEQLKNGAILELGRMMLALLAGLLALSDRRRPLFLGIAFVSVALAVNLINHLWPDAVPLWVFPLMAFLFAGYVVLHLFQFIFRSPKVNSEVVCAGITGYLMLALMWALAYDFVGRLDPHAFVFAVGPNASHVMKGFTALYFSCITLCTVGYGDIVPVTGASRMLAMEVGMTGTLFVSVFIARLVALYSTVSNEQKN